MPETMDLNFQLQLSAKNELLESLFLFSHNAKITSWKYLEQKRE
jgi:hypothetical protein